MTSPSTRAPGRPPDAARAERILDAAWTLFLRHGVDAVPIEAIARAARVSKITIYRHFHDKTALFMAVILREMVRIEAAQAPPGPACGLRETLVAFGTGILSYLATDTAIDFYGALSGELRRHPGLARAFHQNGPGRTRANLARVLAGGVAAGALRACDPDAAAAHLFGLWQGFSNFELALGVDTEAIRAGVAARVETGVDVFLRAYGA